MKQRIVILGAGFAGVRAALDLAKKTTDQIILINQTNYHTYIPDLYSTAAVRLHKNIDIEKLTEAVNIKLETIFKGRIKVIVDTALSVDLPQNQIKLSSGLVDFDYLVLSLGGRTNYFNIPGADQFSHPLKTSEDALKIRTDLARLLETKGQELKVVVAGAGFLGVEIAAELKTNLAKTAQVSIIEALPSVLTGMSTWCQNQTLERLKKLKITVLTNHPIKKVEQSEIICSGDDNIAYDYLIWTAGVQGENLQQQIKGVEFNKRNQIEVPLTLQIPQYPKVFVAGDLAGVQDPVRNLFVPPTAWAAMGEAQVAAENIKRVIQGQTLKEYHPPKAAFVVPIGGKFAIADLFGVEMSGFLIWCLKQLISFKYIYSIVDPLTATKIWLKEIALFL